MPVIKAGDRVRVTRTVEGVVQSVYRASAGLHTKITLTNGMTYVLGGNTQIEVLEPEYEVGNVYKDRYGNHWLRSAAGWYAFGESALRPHDAPPRPLVKLVEEGK